MGKAQNVVQSAPGGLDTTSYVCPTDSEKCEALEVVLPEGVTFEEYCEVVKKILPCSVCRAMEQDARKLSGTRLGKHERRVLLLAPSSNAEDPEIIEPENNTRSASEVVRRAVRKLCRSGLVSMHLRDADVEVQRVKTYGYEYTTRDRRYKRALKLTPLGDTVVGELREVLSKNESIRWAVLIKGFIDRTRCGPDLLDEMVRESAINTIERYKQNLEIIRIAGTAHSIEYGKRLAREIIIYQSLVKKQTTG